MEVFKTYKAVYSQKGHYMYPEDTWSSKYIISNEKNLYNWMKQLHKRSASNFNNYPFCSLFTPENISFYEREELKYNNKIFRTSYTSCSPPEYFDNVVKKYEEWYSYIEKRLPRLREVYKKRIKIESDIKLLNKLKEKYE